MRYIMINHKSQVRDMRLIDADERSSADDVARRFEVVGAQNQESGLARREAIHVFDAEPGLGEMFDGLRDLSRIAIGDNGKYFADIRADLMVFQDLKRFVRIGCDQSQDAKFGSVRYGSGDDPDFVVCNQAEDFVQAAEFIFQENGNLLNCHKK